LGAEGVWPGMSPWLSDRLLGAQSDERLVALACAGSDRAFAAIVQRYRRPLFAFARQLNANGEAEDLVQQTFLSALAAIRTGVEIRHLRGWLHQILRNAAVHAAKRGTLSAELDHDGGVAPSAQQAAELRMLTAEALAALAQLPARQHEALLATAVQGRSRAEVAQVLGLTEGAVRQLVHRARESLRAAVTAITPYPLAQAFAAGPSGGGLAELASGAGAGSVGALALKVGAVVASGVVATGIVVSGAHRSAHPGERHGRMNATVGLASAASPGTGDLRLAADHIVNGGPMTPGGRGSARSGGGGPGGDGSHSGGDGSGGGSDGSPGGSSVGSGSSDGGGGGTSTSGSDGGPSATTASSSEGGGGSGSSSGSSDGGSTTTTSGSDGGSSGGSGSSDGGQTTTTTTSGN
jgi:RNA polymerase sigma factor (sigma-70 family)